jgi:transcriptional regulator GlxA family with amidase domain
VGAALTLLASSDLTLAEIARRVRFCDCPHRSRVVIAHTGRTPLQTRAEARGQE